MPSLEHAMARAIERNRQEGQVFLQAARREVFLIDPRVRAGSDTPGWQW